MLAKVLQTVLLTLALGTVSCANGDASVVPDETTGGTRNANATGGSAAAQSQPSGGSGSGGISATASGGSSSTLTGGNASGGATAAPLGGAPSASGGTPSTGGTNTETGGVNTAGNSATGGESTGGSETTGGDSNAGGDSNVGGADAVGGTSASGGTAAGGTATGGSAGNTATGGVSNGGTSATGGVAAGGTASGGTASGGADSGGSATGGTSTTNTFDACTANTLLTGGKTYCAASTGSAGNGYTYSVSITTPATWFACDTVYGKDAAFKSNWSTTVNTDFISSVGLALDSTKTYSDFGTLESDFAFTKTGTGACTIGVRGATATPALEYFIIEDWNGTRPTYTTKLSTITVDDGQYDVYRRVPIGPGSPTTTQYYSIRTAGRHCGHISISEHFRQWVSLGMSATTKLVDSKLFVEATGGVGTVDFTWATLTAN